jgi:CRP-like cAMP-binding protein
MIDPKLLIQFKAEILKIERGNVIFNYGSKAQFYYQIKTGEVKMNNFNRDGKEFIQAHFKISEVLASRLYYKAIMASEISSQDPEHRIVRLLDYTKTHIHKLDPKDVLEVDLTRQQIADLTGLRVETVIRACKALEKKGEIQIKARKILR